MSLPQTNLLCSKSKTFSFPYIAYLGLFSSQLLGLFMLLCLHLLGSVVCLASLGRKFHEGTLSCSSMYSQRRKQHMGRTHGRSSGNIC